jgi:hypothetical protein
MNALQTFLTNAQTILNAAAVAGITVACIVCGYMFFTAHDSVDRMSSAKVMLRNIIIGSILILGANLIVGTLKILAGG